MTKLLLPLWFLIVAYHTQAATSPTPQQKDVTLLVYYSGDNNLSHFMKSSLERVIQEGGSDKVHVVAQYDGDKPKDSLRLSLSSLNNQPLIHAQNIEYDMGDPQTLGDFVQWGMENFPATRTILLINAHGRGVLNVPISDGSEFGKTSQVLRLASSSDDTSHTYMNEEVVVATLQKVLKGRKLDMLIYSSCLMGNLEVLTMLAPVAKFVIASVYPIYVSLKDGEDVKGRAISVEKILSSLKEDPRMPETKLARRIFEDFGENYKDFASPAADADAGVEERYPSTLALYDLSRISELATEFTKTLESFAIQISKDPSLLQKFFRNNLTSHYIDSLGYIDVLEFHRSVIHTLGSPDASEQIHSFEKTLFNVVVDKVEMFSESSGKMGHMSIFFPRITSEINYVNRYKEFYSEIQVTRKYGWNRFLDYFWARTPGQLDVFWLSLLKSWDAGETVYVTPRKNPEYADHYLFLYLDSLPIRWAHSGNIEKIKDYYRILTGLRRPSPDLQNHIRYTYKFIKDAAPF